jgi:diguanylate cyclase (GGDEF)-like protein
MYPGESAEIVAVREDMTGLKRIRDMGLREGKLIDMIHYDGICSRKVIISCDNARIAFDVSVASEITVRPLKSCYEAVRTQANYDSLTGCLNRNAMSTIFAAEYEKFAAAKLPLSLLLTDIDHFKRINDTRGHQAGDSVLKGVAGLLQRQLRRSDSLCRWGGEEFLILLRGTLITEALQIAERLRHAVETHVFPPFAEQGLVTVSIGSSGLPPAGGMHELFERADKALYDAKRSGRNRVRIHEGCR